MRPAAERSLAERVFVRAHAPARAAGPEGEPVAVQLVPAAASTVCLQQLMVDIEAVGKGALADAGWCGLVGCAEARLARS